MNILQNVMEELDTDEKIAGMSTLITLIKNSKLLLVKVLAVLFEANMPKVVCKLTFTVGCELHYCNSIYGLAVSALLY